MLNPIWIKKPDHGAYCKEEEILPRLTRDLGISNLAEYVTELRAHPVAEGVNLKGKKRTAVKMFVPNLLFPIDMGKNVWLYMGDLYPACCLSLGGRCESVRSGHRGTAV